VESNLEYGRIRVLVDGHNDLGIPHPCQVLYRPGDSESDIELRRHDLPSLPNLQGIVTANKKTCMYDVVT
jgi:hypothetical protein